MLISLFKPSHAAVTPLSLLTASVHCRCSLTVGIEGNWGGRELERCNNRDGEQVPAEVPGSEAVP